MRKIKWKNVLVAAGVAACIGVYATDALKEEPVIVEYHKTARAGDTVWGICSRIASDKDDLSMVTYRAMHDSHIEKGTNLKPGDEVIVRVKAVAE